MVTSVVCSITFQKHAMLDFCVFTDCGATLKSEEIKRNFSFMYEDKNGRLIFHARYGNCYEGSNPNTAHAEYFMLVDEEFRQAVKVLKTNNRMAEILLCI